MDEQHERSAAGSRRSRIARRAVLWFVVADVVAVSVVAGFGYWVARRLAVEEAIDQAVAVVDVDARHVAPELTPAALRREPAAHARIDEVVIERVLSDTVIRVKVWDADGRIVYSDDDELVGERYGLDEEELESLRDGRIEAELSELGKPENRNERRYGQLLEVYKGVSTPAGPLLFESYLRYDRVSRDGSEVLSRFAPALLGGLLALFLLQIPLAVLLRSQVARAESSQRKLLQQTLDISERERRGIASDLHDSVVQGLAGTSLSLAALADARSAAGDEDTATRLRGTSAELRQWVRELRTLIVNLVPRRLHEEGLVPALADLGSSLQSRGIEVVYDLEPLHDLSPSTQALLFRAAQEAVRNVVEHAGATYVWMTLGALGPDRVRLVVADNGRGMDAETVAAARTGGHVGLQLLGDLVADAGGSLTVWPADGGGTIVAVEVAAR